MNLMIPVIAAGFLALVFASYLVFSILKQPQGTPRIKEICNLLFPDRQYRFRSNNQQVTD